MSGDSAAGACDVRSGRPFAIAAFCSNQREEVRYYRVTDFDADYDRRSQSCLAGLSGGYSTRLGTAIRHAGADIKTRLTHRRLILSMSDGEPSDIDILDKNYLVEDARDAVHSMARTELMYFVWPWIPVEKIIWHAFSDSATSSR